jgi:hypothetical protein
LLESRADTIAALAPLCQEQAIVTTAVFDPSDNHLHPLIFLTQEGEEHPMSEMLPAEWWPASPQHVELVACASLEYTRTIDTCNYQYSVSYDRNQYLVDIRLYEANTARSLQFGTLEGSIPPECAGSVRMNQSNGDAFGTHINSEQLIGFFDAYVNSSGELKPLTIAD